MNKFIKAQLNKCKIANIPEFDDNTVELLISTNYNINTVKSDWEQGSECDIEVEDYIIHPYPGFTLHDNWNGGIIPTDKQMHILILNNMGKMIKVQAKGINNNKLWEGWLPKKSCKLI